MADEHAGQLDTTLLINNASTAEFAGPLDADPGAVRREMAVNYDGTYATIRAFVPVLDANRGGHIVNVLSLLSLASSAPMTGYSASKAAAHSLTQALRRAGSPCTASTRRASTPTCSPASTSRRRRPPRSPRGSSTGLAAGEEDIFPDANAQAMSTVWRSDPKAVERALARSAPA